MSTGTPAETPGDPQWEERRRYWERKLRRLRLDAEPVEDQVDRYLRVTLVLTAVPAALGVVFLGLFTAFGRPDVGGWLVLILLGPVVAVAWLDFARLRGNASRYLREREPAGRARTPGGA